MGSPNRVSSRSVGCFRSMLGRGIPSRSNWLKQKELFRLYPALKRYRGWIWVSLGCNLLIFHGTPLQWILHILQKVQACNEGSQVQGLHYIVSSTAELVVWIGGWVSEPLVLEERNGAFHHQTRLQTAEADYSELANNSTLKPVLFFVLCFFSPSCPLALAGKGNPSQA